MTDEQSARLIGTIPGLRETLESSITGIQSGNVSSSKAVADTIQLGQRAIEDGNGLFLAKISMIDPAFSAVADFIMQGRASAIQLENINSVLGTSFTELGQAQAEFNAQHDEQLKVAEDLAKQGKLNEENLRAAGMDDKTIGILLNAVKVEDAVGSFQAGLFETTNNLGALDVQINALIDSMNKVLRTLDPDYESPQERRARLQQMAQDGAEMFLGDVAAPGSFRGSNEVMARTILDSGVMGELSDSMGANRTRDYIQGQSMDLEELKTYNENMQMFQNGGPQFDDITGELKTNNTKIGQCGYRIKKQYHCIQKGNRNQWPYSNKGIELNSCNKELIQV